MRHMRALHYYLTFIHFFGFSINPSDDLQARYLSVRVRRAAAVAAVSKPAKTERRGRPGLRPEQQQQESGQRLASVSLRASRSAGRVQHQYDQDHNEPGGGPPASRPVGWSRLKLALKFYAIALTAFLALNHMIVLCDYIWRGSKVFMELMLELRLVITKSSALIFVLAWHLNRAKVRQLIKLVGSTTRHILAGRGDEQLAQLTGRPADQSQHIGAQLDRRVIKWWLMCVCISVTHFSLSEAEIRTAQHLWQWLDDYSLHQLSNRTTSAETLLAMASFDNYIYTVHVYGTRLIGASIICIVCSFQMESIRCLRRRALRLLRPLARTTPRPGNQADWPTNCVTGWLGSGRAGRLDRRRLFVLGASDWLQVEANSAGRRIGWLSSGLPVWRVHSSGAQTASTPRPATHEAGREPTPCSGARLEAQLDELARKYELVRTINLRIDHCFGRLLLVQYSFLFLMSCIDVVYFSLSFNPQTKTKYIIVSGMILLWWPYLLIYKFSSDIWAESKELLVSIRRLARLALISRLQEDQGAGRARSPIRPGWLAAASSPTGRQHELSLTASLVGGSRWQRRLEQTLQMAAQFGRPGQRPGAAGQGQACTRIFNKLDHVFKPSHLSILGIMAMDKIFLLNFGKIVITASVMTIQFITK